MQRPVQQVRESTDFTSSQVIYAAGSWAIPSARLENMEHGFIFFLIYLAGLDLSCSTQDLWLQHANFELQYVGSSLLTRDQTQVPCIGTTKS